MVKTEYSFKTGQSDLWDMSSNSEKFYNHRPRSSGDPNNQYHKNGIHYDNNLEMRKVLMVYAKQLEL